jgi:S-adenosylmethionine hydrolase
LTGLPTVFFLSDYGGRDEFVGVVHAVLVAGSPGVTVIDLAHEVPAFDVRAGARTLERALPYLGPGVVLAVVDPGVGSGRRGLCLRVGLPRGGPEFFIGPDNGLLIGAAASVAPGLPLRAFELRPTGGKPVGGPTFDGRDLFAPAAAALCRGLGPEELGDPIDPASLVRLHPDAVQYGHLPDGRHYLETEVSWIDRFGNVQLAATGGDAETAGVPRAGTVDLRATSAHQGPDTTLRRVEVFADLARGELGLLVDANGHVALVAGAASAAQLLRTAPGAPVMLTW